MGSQSDRFRTVFHARWFNADSFIESGKQLGCQSVFPDCVENLQKIGIEELRAAGFINRRQLVKILANGAVTTALTVEANAFSKAAEEAITAAGGSIQKV